MKSIEEFSFADEPGKIQTKANIKQTIERPRISIVTPFYNAERNFEQTYHCVINQSMQEFEWVIVDDGSSRPGVIALLEEYSEKDARIHVIRQKNRYAKPFLHIRNYRHIHILILCRVLAATF